MSPSLHHPISIIFFNTASRPALISLFLSNSVKKLPGILGAHGYCSWGVMGLGYFFLFFFLLGGGVPLGALKAWIKAQMSGRYLFYSHIFLPLFVHIVSLG